MGPSGIGCLPILCYEMSFLVAAFLSLALLFLLGPVGARTMVARARARLLRAMKTRRGKSQMKEANNRLQARREVGADALALGRGKVSSGPWS